MGEDNIKVIVRCRPLNENEKNGHGRGTAQGLQALLLPQAAIVVADITASSALALHMCVVPFFSVLVREKKSGLMNSRGHPLAARS